MRIIYFDIDTLRADHLSCYGYLRKTSPTIDEIAEEGVRFENCMVSDAPCLPSRTALFTGRFGIHTGVVGHGGTSADIRITGRDRGFRDQFADSCWIPILRKLGFYPVTISPFAERHSSWIFYAGWREMYNPGKRGAEIADDLWAYAEKWLKENAHKDKWFLHINFWDPHTTYRTPKEFGNPFKDEPIEEWLTEEILLKHRQSYGPHSAQDLVGFGFPEEIERARTRNPDLPLEIRTLEDYKRWIDGYDTGIRYADEFIRKCINILKEKGVYEDTAIIISADHGENQGELNVYGDHQTADHITCRVPLIIKWPGVKPRVDKALHYHVDMSATVIELLGGEIPEGWDGKSFAKAFVEGREEGREFTVMSQCAWSCQRAVRFENWTLIRTYHTGLKDFPEIMLFDVEKDFHMLHNLAEERKDVVGKGLEYLDKWHKEMMKTSSSPVDPMWMVIREGGPYHTRGFLERYLERLKATGRGHLIDKILSRNEPYW